MISNYLFLPVWQRIMLNISQTEKLKEKSIYRISRRVDSNYQHTKNILAVLSDIGVITLEKKGRINEVTLTKKGINLQNLIRQVENLVDGSVGAFTEC